MSRDIDSILRERYVVELNKPKVEKEERAQVIKKLLQDRGWSQREFSRQMGFKKSTVEDWLLWDDPRVPELRAAGYSDTEIYKVLRGHRLKAKGNRKKLFGSEIVNDRLNSMAGQIKTMIHNGEYDESTETAIANVVNECNRFSSFIKRDQNGSIKKKPKKKGKK